MPFSAQKHTKRKRMKLFDEVWCFQYSTEPSGAVNGLHSSLPRFYFRDLRFEVSIKQATNFQLEGIHPSETWMAMEKLLKMPGAPVRSIGLANFNSAQVKDL